MQLQIFNTGNVVTTCGEDGVHTPTVWYFNGFPVRVIFRPNLPADRALAFVKTDAAKALGYKTAHVAGESMNLIRGEDRDDERIVTPGGPQKMAVLTFKGLSKFLMRSDHRTALEFQDWLASKSSDLAFHGFAIADKSAAEQLDGDSVLITRESLKWLCDRSAELNRQAAQSNQGLSGSQIAEIVAQVVTTLLDARESRPAVGPIRRGLRHQSEFPAWSLGEHHRMRKLGYVQSSEFLTRETGQRPAYGKAGGLALRAANYCRQHEIPVHRFFKGASVVVYLHEDTLKAVYRTGWSARTAVLSEAQMGLFGGQA